MISFSKMLSVHRVMAGLVFYTSIAGKHYEDWTPTVRLDISEGKGREKSEP